MKRKRNKRGQFQTKPTTTEQAVVEAKPVENEPCNVQLIKQRLIEGYWEIDEVRKAYKEITGNDVANVIVMRRTILNHNA